MRTLAVAISLAVIPQAVAGEFNKKLSVGDSAPVWADLPGTDGKKHSLADLKEKDIVVVVFTCNSCDISVAYEERIAAFVKKYAADGKVALVAVNVSTRPDDALEKMTEHAKEQGFTFPYLLDESQKVGRAYGAGYTPEFFVLDKGRKVVYMGAMDDKLRAEDVKVNYLDLAVQAALKGEKPATAETQARGCLIRYAREKK
jgi:peroxiredoxin